jgi:hypothetical protein
VPSRAPLQPCGDTGLRVRPSGASSACGSGRQFDASALPRCHPGLDIVIRRKCQQPPVGGLSRASSTAAPYLRAATRSPLAAWASPNRNAPGSSRTPRTRPATCGALSPLYRPRVCTTLLSQP